MNKVKHIINIWNVAIDNRGNVKGRVLPIEKDAVGS